MPDLEPITRDEKLWSGEDLEPITRREMYIKHLYDETQVIPDKPITREEMFILKAGEELHDVTIEQLTATENRTYSEEGVAYSPVIVNVPQTTLTTLDVTENGTYTAPSGTAYNEVDVDVPLPDNAYLLKDIANTPASIATFTDGSALPMPKLEIAVEPQQDLHGYDAPWVGGAGKNKSEKKITEFSYSVNANGSSSVSGDILTVTTTSMNNSGVYSYLSFVESFTGKCSYSVDVKASTSASALIGMTNAGRKSVDLTTNWQRVKFEDVTFDGTEKILCIYSQGTANIIQLKDFMFETGSTAHDYEPYSNECPISGWSAVDVTVADDVDNPTTTKTITIQLGDTYYGCKLDVVSGVLTVDRAYVDLGTLEWNYSSISERFYVGASDLGVKATDASTPFNAISSALIAKSYNEIEAKTVDYAIGINPNATQLFARYSSITSASDFITAMDGVQLVYELATPTIIQLSPTQVSSLMGVNNIWADCGDIIDGQYFGKEV